MASMLWDIVAFHLRAPIPAIHALAMLTTKGVAWFSIPMHACSLVPSIIMGLCLVVVLCIKNFQQ